MRAGIPILKPGKQPENSQSYKPLNLLPLFSKVFEKLLVTRILPTLQVKQAIPDHQSEFRKKHATTVKVHRIVSIIHDVQESDQYARLHFYTLVKHLTKSGIKASSKKQKPFSRIIYKTSHNHTCRTDNF
jgi:hypothetical protein